MPGGLLNLIAYGNLNVILNGNPSKTFFRTTYAKYTNFGLQRLRVDYKTLNRLRLNDDSFFEFIVPRYADLLGDMYLSITLPNIWSPIYNPSVLGGGDVSFCQPYEFKWIDNIGSQIIRQVRYLIDGHIIQEFTGEYLYSMVQRDFSTDKKQLFNELTGNIAELNDPANYSDRNGNYPNASYGSTNGPGRAGITPHIATLGTRGIWRDGLDPSIRTRQLNIPLNIWSTLSTKMAFPLTCLQYNNLHIQVDLRPIEELFVVRDIDYFLDRYGPGGTVPPDYTIYDCPYIRPNFNDPKYQLYYFINEPSDYRPTVPYIGFGEDAVFYSNTSGGWEENIHLLGTFIFLGDEERRVFTAQPQSYLIKEIVEETKYNVTGTQRASITNVGLVSSWMWFFQRSDVVLRNQWTNYTNWEYKTMPYSCVSVFDLSENLTSMTTVFGSSYPGSYPPVCPVTYKFSNMLVSGPLHIENQREIMVNWGLLCDGKVRETVFPEGVVNLVEKYVRTAGNAPSGLYCYNFCLNTDPFLTQPSGAMNLSKFTDVEFEYTTILPYDTSGNNAVVPVICDKDGNILGVDNPTWKDYEYSYNLHIMEEKYNVLMFESGMARLAFRR
jgi:hypothetical protein